MRLSILSRITLLNLLPAEGTIITLRIIRDLRMALSFTEQEHAMYSIKTTGDRITWNASADKGKDIEIGPKAFVLVSDTLTALDKQGKLKSEHIELYDRFVDSPSPSVGVDTNSKVEKEHNLRQVKTSKESGN